MVPLKIEIKYLKKSKLTILYVAELTFHTIIASILNTEETKLNQTIDFLYK